MPSRYNTYNTIWTMNNFHFLLWVLSIINNYINEELTNCYATYPFCITFFQIESYFLRAIFTMQTQYLYFRNVLTTTLPPSKNFSANHAICITCFQIESYFLGDIVTTQSHYLYFRNVLAIILPQPQRLLREWCPHDTLLLKLYTNQNNI